MSLNRYQGRALLKKWARACHVYFSLLGLVLLFFFSLTGFMMNHPDWFARDATETRSYSFNLSPELVQAEDKLAIVESLRRNAAVTGFLESFTTRTDRLFLSFKSPGRQFDVEIARATGVAQITCEWHGVLARITELHRGTDAGPVWRLVIDATALLLMAIVLTGIILWLMAPQWRTYGIAAVAICTLACGLIYLFAIA